MCIIQDVSDQKQSKSIHSAEQKNDESVNNLSMCGF